MLEVLTALAKYVNEINWIDAHFESVAGSKFTESLAANQKSQFLNPAITRVQDFPQSDKHFFAEFSILFLLLQLQKCWGARTLEE